MYECVRVCFFVEWMEVHEQLDACHVCHVCHECHVRCMQRQMNVFVCTLQRQMNVFVCTRQMNVFVFTLIYANKCILEKLNLKLSETIHNLTNYCKCKQVHPGETPASWIMHGNLWMKVNKTQLN